MPEPYSDEEEDLMKGCPEEGEEDYTVSEAAAAAAAAEAAAGSDADEAGEASGSSSDSEGTSDDFSSDEGELLATSDAIWSKASRMLAARYLLQDDRLTDREITDARAVLYGLQLSLGVTTPSGRRLLGRRGPMNTGNTITDRLMATILQAEDYESALQPMIKSLKAGTLSGGDLDRLNDLIKEYCRFLRSHAGESQPAGQQGAVGTEGVGAVGTPAAVYDGTVGAITPDTAIPSSPSPGAVRTSPSSTSVDASAALLLKYTKAPMMFTGAAGDDPIRHWLTSMAHFLTTTRIPVRDGVGVAVSYLRGQAQQYWFSNLTNITAAGEDPKCWDTFKKWMVMGFGATDPEVEARYKIDRLRQTASVAEYVRDLQALFAQLARKPMSESDKVHKFHTGLKPVVAAKVQMNPVTQQPFDTFIEAAQYAIRQDNAFTTSMLRSNTSTAAPPGAIRKIKKQRPSWRKTKPWLDSESRRGELKGLFKGKHHKGGRASDANPGNGAESSRQAEARGRQQAEAAERLRRFQNRLCLKCGKPGHQKKDCPDNAG